MVEKVSGLFRSLQRRAIAAKAISMDTPSEPHQAQPRPKAGTAEYRRLKGLIQTRIVDHLGQHGPRAWNAIREDPEFAPLIGRIAGPSGKKLFHRWVDDVRNVPPEDQTRPHEGREAAEANLRIAEEQIQERIARNLPVTPAHAFWMKHGADGHPRVDFGAALAQNMEDADRARLVALRPDPNAPGGWAVGDPDLLLKAGRQMNETLRTAALLMPDIRHYAGLQAFVRKIRDALIAAFPDDMVVQQRVIDALQETVFGALKVDGLAPQ